MFPEKMPRHLPWPFLAIRIYQTLVSSTIVSFTEKAFDHIYWRKAFRVYDYLCPSSVRNYSNRLARNLPPLTQLQTYIQQHILLSKSLDTGIYINSKQLSFLKSAKTCIEIVNFILFCCNEIESNIFFFFFFFAKFVMKWPKIIQNG